MSFRRRLTLFFILIVVLPMVALAALVLQVASSSRTGKADARLAAGLETALAVYRDDLAAAQDAARAAAEDPELAAAIRAGRREAIDDALTRVVRRDRITGARVLSRNGSTIATAGSRETVADAELTLERGGRTEGTLVASVTSASQYADRIRDLTGRSAVVSDDTGSVVATTVPISEVRLPEPGTAQTVELVSDELRAASATLGKGEGAQRVTLLGRIDSRGFAATRPLIAAALAGFFVIALVFVAMLMRALQGQVGGMLAAARRIGSGDFSRKLPVEGNDEMAGLAREFNQMSDKLSQQMGELRRQRNELEQSVRRIGEAFASGLDRSALLEIVAETAASACEAEHARIVLSAGRDPEAEAGDPLTGSMRDAVVEAEDRALRTRNTAEAEIGDAFAVAHPIHTAEGGSGVMSLARRGRGFEEGKRDVLRYLIGQAAVSIENVELHEVVAEQAVTDELTGLPNNRRFRRWIGSEAARAERFGHELSLLMIDIDDFKQVNDTFGHLQGDEVLRAIGRVLMEESRGVDEPARYGGEEFAVGLPETGIEGAVDFAERVRNRLESTEIPRVEGEGTISVTASVGAATAGPGTVDPRGLIEAADQALYRAKRAGKNRVAKGAAPSSTGGWVADGEGKAAPSAKIRSDG